MIGMRRGRFSGFLVISALLIVATVISAGLLVGAFFKNHVLAHEQEQIAEIVQSQALQHLTPGVFKDSGDPVSTQVFQTFLEGLPGVFRIKAFDPTGKIVWSNESRLIGMVFADNVELGRALAGEAANIIMAPTKPEHLYERHKPYVGEVYVPVAFPGTTRTVGVIEAYKDLTSVMAGVHRTQQRIWAITGGMGVFLYLSLAVVVWMASASELRAMRRLEAQNRELVFLHNFTRSVVRSLDLGQVADSVVQSAGAELGLARARIYEVRQAGDPVLLAVWPAQAGEESPPTELIQQVLTTRAEVIRGCEVAMPCVTSKHVTHVFVGRSSSPLHSDSATVRTLEIMLHQAAVALTNVDLFREIREAHERLAAILSGIADRMLIVDRDMRIVWMNAVGGETNGLGDEILGTACFQALAGGSEACRDCPAIRTFRSGHVERGVRAARGAGGRTRYMDLVTAPLRDASGDVAHVLEVARDITELVEMDERLKDVNRALREAQAELVKKERLAAVGQMVVGLHHAILNPLSGVLGALVVLKADSLSQCEKAQALADAEAEIRRIERLIRQLPEIRETKSLPYVGEATMLDLEHVFDVEPHRGV